MGLLTKGIHQELDRLDLLTYKCTISQLYDWYLSYISQYLRTKHRRKMYNHYGNGRRKPFDEEQDKSDKEDREWMSRWSVFCWRCVISAKICIEGHSGQKITQGKRTVENQVWGAIESVSFQSSVEQSLSEDGWLLALGTIHQYSLWTLRRKCGSWLRKAQRVQLALQFLDSYALWWTASLIDTREVQDHT